MTDDKPTPEDVMEAALALIDEHFRNNRGRRVKTCIPAEPDDTDIVLTSYLRHAAEQTRELQAKLEDMTVAYNMQKSLRAGTLTSLERAEAALRDAEAKYQACYAQLVKEQAAHAKLREVLRDAGQWMTLQTIIPAMHPSSQAQNERSRKEVLNKIKAALEGQDE